MLARTDPGSIGATGAGLDVNELRRYLDPVVPGGLAGPLEAAVLSGGRSNLTYLISDGSRRWVLRRPPLGHVLETAHDMGREVTVLRALHGSAVPVPAVLAHTRDLEIIGTEFFVMEHVDGIVYRTHEQLAALTTPQARALSFEFVDVLADLHLLDHQKVGLSDLGRPDGYLERQLRRWSKQLVLSTSRELPGIDRLSEFLTRDIPRSVASGLVHGDYRQDNVIVATDEPGRMLAVLDWEMATLGDPMSDIGMLAVYWEGWAGLDNPVTAVPGEHAVFPGFAELLERYVARTDADVARLNWYAAFGFFKLAVLLEGIYFRYLAGQTVGAGFERIGAMVPGLIARGLEVASRSEGASWSSPTT